ncbi:TniQ family protein [Streptomyces sp. NPDC050485]|uniref:TniQ family protein n=1 Tax=Streptomyces sp. NPDC050485 TaxID=3365617 RepID=UPI0037BB8B8F
MDDESLIGFILRLASHTGSTPIAIARRMGLTPRYMGRMSILTKHLISLPPGQLADAAHAARLSETEMQGLLLAPLGERYGPLAEDYLRRPHSRNSYLRPWTYTRHSQFCRSCLLEDKTDLGMILGGSWKRRWHLPVVFACVRHRQLLKDSCPHCHTPIHAARLGRFLENANTPDLHPLQCRAFPRWNPEERGMPFCGAYVTGRSASSISSNLQTRDAVLNLQSTFDNLLSVNGPDFTESCGTTVSTAQYFNDVRMMATLVLASWPHARRYTATPALAMALTGALGLLQHDDQRTRVQTTRYRRANQALYLAPPQAPRVRAALLGTAVKILAVSERTQLSNEVWHMQRRARDLHPELPQKIGRQPGISPALMSIFYVT